LTFIYKFNYLVANSLKFEKYSLYLNELLRATYPYSHGCDAGNAGAFTCPPFGPAKLFKFIPDEFLRKNLAAPGKLLLPSPKSAYFWCSTIGTPNRRDAGRTIPVGDLDRSPSFAIFPLNFFPFMQYTG
jgi:hypothetical protein